MYSRAGLCDPDAVTHHRFLIQEPMEGTALAQHAKLPMKTPGTGARSRSTVIPVSPQTSYLAGECVQGRLGPEASPRISALQLRSPEGQRFLPRELTAPCPHIHQFLPHILPFSISLLESGMGAAGAGTLGCPCHIVEFG